MTTTRTHCRNHKNGPNRPRPAFLSPPCSGAGRGEDGFVLVMALVLLILLTLLGLLALNTSDFENMVAGGVQQAESRFNVAEGGNYLEACNVGFVRREWYKLADPEKFEQPMIPDKQRDYNPGGRANKKDGLEYALDNDAYDGKAKIARENVGKWPFGNLNARDDDGMVSTEDGYKDEAGDYRYLVTYISYENIRLPGYSTEVGGFGTYTFRIQSAPGEQGQGAVVETAGLKYGMQQTL